MIEDIIIKVDEIFKEYHKTDSFAQLPINLEKIVQIVSNKMGGVPISFCQRDWDSKRIKGRLLRYNDHVVIETATNGLNTCWERFIRCKELCHLVLDEKDAYTTDPINLVQEILELKAIGLKVEPSPALLSESAAEIAAIEILFPLAMRSQFTDAIKTEGWPHVKVATYFRIPTFYVERVLSDAYVNAVDSVHRKLIQDGRVEY